MQFGISEAIEHWATYQPHAIAVVSDRNKITYRDLNTRIQRLAGSLRAEFRNAPRIGVLVWRKPDFLATVIAIVRTRKSAVILNQLLDAESLARCASDARTTAVLFDSEFRRNSPLLTGFLEDNEAKNISRLTTATTKSDALPFSCATPTDEWGVFYSSGTTGVPKGIVRDHYSVVTEVLGWCLELRVERDTYFYMGRPLFYTGGLLLSLSTLLMGGTVGIDSEVSWDLYQRHLRNRRVDWAFFVPDQVREFVRAADAQKKKPHAPISILVMGAPIDGHEKCEAAAKLRATVIESWGNSESLGTITTSEDLAIRPNSIGRPFFTDRLLIVDKHGRSVPPGERGRIAGGVEAGFSEYCNRPADTRKTIKRELIVSGDIGHTDRARYFYIDGREEDLVLIRRRLVFTNKIEARLRTMPEVKECAVVARSRPRQLVAFVTLKSGCSVKAETLLQRVNRKLRQEERIATVRILETLPRNAAGKVAKPALASLPVR